MKPVDSIGLIFARLTWPSVIARERAVTEMARLLVNPDHSNVVRERLLAWIKEQSIESRSVIGLLVLLKAAMIDRTFVLPSAREIDAAVRSPSLLSWMLRKEILRHTSTSTLRMDGYHSDDAPDEFVVPPFFERKNNIRFLPPIYFERGARIQRRAGIPFMRQWAYEWELLVRRLGFTPDRSTSDFWFGYAPDEFSSADTLLSDVYRSAYLRTLAWSLSTGQIEVSMALFFAAQTCPVDLSLWQSEPQPPPAWWPVVDMAHGLSDDELLDSAWRQVSNLWERQRDGDGWIVGHATGALSVGATKTLVLEIGCLIHSRGMGNAPLPEEIWHWYEQYDSSAVDVPSLLRFEGHIERGEGETMEYCIANDFFLPVATLAEPFAYPRWQNWRVGFQGVALPTFALTGKRMTFKGTKEGVDVYLSRNVIGQWRDWSRAVRERGFHTPPKDCGRYLFIKQDVLNRAASRCNGDIAWVCRLTLYNHRSSYNEELKKSDTYRLFNTLRDTTA